MLGKHSGRAALDVGWNSLDSRFRAMNCSTYTRFVALADRKKNIPDQDLVGLADGIRRRRREPFSEWIGLWLAALNVKYRDVRYTLGFLVQFWFLATPIAYPTSVVPDAGGYGTD